MPLLCAAMLLCPAHLHGFMGLLIVDVDKPQNYLYPRDIDSLCGCSTSEVTVEQCILACVIPESMSDVAKLAIRNFFEKFMCV